MINILEFVLSFGIIAATSGENCDHLGVLLYEDLGCTPHHKEAEPCPVKYSCQGLEESDTYCYFRGKAYRNLENVDESLIDASCDSACTCVIDEGRSNFVCAVLDCPDWLGVPTTPGCYRNYSLDSCCVTGEICPPFDEEAKCEYDGIGYREGERFFPNNSCLDCVCQKGFDGKLEEPFCRRRSCGIQLKRSDDIKNRCAPFYNKELETPLCCPYPWICPDGSEVIEGEAISDDTCFFGNTTLKVGQKLFKNNVYNGFGETLDNVECKCLIPPLLSCSQTN